MDPGKSRKYQCAFVQKAIVNHAHLHICLKVWHRVNHSLGMYTQSSFALVIFLTCSNASPIVHIAIMEHTQKIPLFVFYIHVNTCENVWHWRVVMACVQFSTNYSLWPPTAHNGKLISRQTFRVLRHLSDGHHTTSGPSPITQKSVWKFVWILTTHTFLHFFRGSRVIKALGDKSRPQSKPFLFLNKRPQFMT